MTKLYGEKDWVPSRYPTCLQTNTANSLTYMNTICLYKTALLDS